MSYPYPDKNLGFEHEPTEPQPHRLDYKVGGVRFDDIPFTPDPHDVEMCEVVGNCKTADPGSIVGVGWSHCGSAIANQHGWFLLLNGRWAMLCEKHKP